MVSVFSASETLTDSVKRWQRTPEGITVSAAALCCRQTYWNIVNPATERSQLLFENFLRLFDFCELV